MAVTRRADKADPPERPPKQSGLIKPGWLRGSVSVIALSVMTGCAVPSPPPYRPSSATGPTGVAVIERGWHTDIALPANDLSGAMANVTQDFPGVQFMVFGFGDRAYYMSPDETALGLLAALFPGQGVILVTALRVPPAEAFGADHVVTLPLSQSQLTAMTAFILRALERRPDASLNRLGDGPYPGSLFYGSTKSYDLLHDCNNWTLTVLQSADLAVDPGGVIFASQVMKQARTLEKQNDDHR